MISEIAENCPNGFLSTRHLGYIDDYGVENTSNAAGNDSLSTKLADTLMPTAASVRARCTPDSAGSASQERTTMSYDIYLYHPSVREESEHGRELDEFSHPSLHKSAVTQFLRGLEQYGYELQSQTAERKTFTKPVGEAQIDVSVYDTEIAFTVAAGDADGIFEALQDASELCDSEHMVLFDPQTGEWQDG
ncbi:hypothetical protein [Steroidobacter cummioxidans]|uniref:hypothetical protein n=1 Tax=Steroidobacter cummioxidans TaxID=1803913 RepID=UPI00129040A0|nr:hypothetical protein [Steroidobacter cummioxidans]